MFCPFFYFLFSFPGIQAVLKYRALLLLEVGKNREHHETELWPRTRGLLILLFDYQMRFLNPGIGKSLIVMLFSWAFSPNPGTLGCNLVELSYRVDNRIIGSI